jgi:membrane dipeptidase
MSVISMPFLPSALLLVLPLLSACGGSGWAEEQISQEAPRIHAEAIVIDTHDDAPGGHIRDEAWSAADLHVYEPGGRGGGGGESSPGQWDIPRMFEGGLDVTGLSVYLGQGPLDEENFARVWERTLALFDWCHEAADSHPDAEIVRTAADIRRLHADGKKGLLIGVENGYPIGTDLSKIEVLYDRGMRYMTLSHNGDNQICASCNPRTEREDFGLTDFGRQVVAELNRLGILIDVAHISDQTFFEVIELSRAPIVATHAGCRAICESSRNLTDEMLLALKENGGVIHLVPLGSFVRGPVPNSERDAAMEALAKEFGDPESRSTEQQAAYRQRSRELRQQFPSPPVTIEDYLKHFDHVVALIGIDHVGFGSDYDGGGGIEGLDDITKLPTITVELMRRGYSEEDIKKFWGENFLRAFEAAEAAAGR